MSVCFDSHLVSTLQVKVYAWSPFGNPLFWFRETFLQVKSPAPKVQVPWWPKWKQLGGLGLHFAYFAYLSTYRWYCTGLLERLSHGLVGSRSTKQARRVRAGDKQKVQEVDDGNKPKARPQIYPPKKWSWVTGNVSETKSPV